METETTLGAFQRHIVAIYGEKDRARGVQTTFLWLVEEIGELAEAIRHGSRAERVHELGDCLAWLVSVADQLDIDIAEVARRYADGCPRCGACPCGCPEPQGSDEAV